jgi:hypothetical protein
MGIVFSSPKMPADEENTTFRAPPCRAASRTRSVPITLISESSIGCSIDRVLPTDAARWKITSQAFGRGAQHGLVADVAVHEPRFRQRGEVLTIARAQVVEHEDVVPFAEEQGHEIRSDETGSAGDERPHRSAAPWLCFHHSTCRRAPSLHATEGRNPYARSNRSDGYTSSAPHLANVR